MEVWQPDKQEIIKVVAWFDPRKPPYQRIICLKFIWRGQEYFARTIDYYHQTREGEEVIHHYSMAVGSTHFKIAFYTKKLLWLIEGISPSN